MRVIDRHARMHRHVCTALTQRARRSPRTQGLSPNEANARGELPMARVMAAATAPTYDNDSNIFDQLIVGGANMDSAGETSHPLLAICKVRLGARQRAVSAGFQVTVQQRSGWQTPTVQSRCNCRHHDRHRF